MRNDGGFLLWWDGLRSEMQPIHDSQGVFAVLEKEVRRLGFDYYAYGVRHTIPFTRPKTEVHGTYPKAWLERYQMQNYGAVDPAILNGLRSSEMVVWSDSLFDQSRMLWNEARDWGLCVGATLPIRAPNNLLSVLSVARDQQNISSFEREEIRLRLRCMIELLTQKLTDLEHPMLMSNPVCLSHREREILQWTADGKSSGEIAIILSIVREHGELPPQEHPEEVRRAEQDAGCRLRRGAGPHLKRRARRPARPTRSGRLPAVHPPLVFPLMCVLVCPPTERAQEYQGRDAAFFSRPARHGDLVMIELLSESLEGLSAAMIAELGRYRHQVFIEKLGWDVVSTSRVRDQEFDQFDHPQTRYIVAMGRQGICGCARLLPTTDAYLLKEVFAYLCSETPPSDPSVWELSRYAASAADDPQLAMKIFWSSLQCAWYLGASSVVAVTTTAMERYFVRNGVILQRLGPPQKVKGETLVAISFPAYQERGLEMLLRYHPEWLQGVPLSMAV